MDKTKFQQALSLQSCIDYQNNMMDYLGSIRRRVDNAELTADETNTLIEELRKTDKGKTVLKSIIESIIETYARKRNQYEKEFEAL